MSYIDILLFVPLLLGAWKGFRKGLVIEITSLAALVLGVWGAIRFSDYIAVLLIEHFTLNEKFLPVLAFGITFLIILIAVFAIGKLVERFVDLMAMGTLNKIAGGVFGAAKFSLIISVLLVIINAYDEKMHFIPKEMKENSLLYVPMTTMALKIVPALENSKILRQNNNAFGLDSAAAQTVVPGVLPE